MPSWLKNLLPTHNPVAYGFVALVLYQIFVQHQAITQEWIQYVVELGAAMGVWSVVTPLAKLKDKE